MQECFQTVSSSDSAARSAKGHLHIEEESELLCKTPSFQQVPAPVAHPAAARSRQLPPAHPAAFPGGGQPQIHGAGGLPPHAAAPPGHGAGPALPILPSHSSCPGRARPPHAASAPVVPLFPVALLVGPSPPPDVVAPVLPFLPTPLLSPHNQAHIGIGGTVGTDLLLALLRRCSHKINCCS
jgi:hypothetical protein